MQGWMIRTGDMLHQPSVEKCRCFQFLLKSVAVVNYGGQSVVNLDYFVTTSRRASFSVYVTVPTVTTRLRLQLSLKSWCWHKIMMVITISSYYLINNDKGGHFHGHHQHNHQHNHFNAFAASPTTDSSSLPTPASSSIEPSSILTAASPSSYHASSSSYDSNTNGITAELS